MWDGEKISERYILFPDMKGNPGSFDSSGNRRSFYGDDTKINAILPEIIREFYTRTTLTLSMLRDNSLKSGVGSSADRPDPTEMRGGSRPPLELQHRDAELFGLVGEVFLDAIAREDEHAHREHVQHGVVALERCGLGVFGPVGFEGDLRDLPGLGPFGGEEFCALRAPTVEKDHVGIFGPDLIELAQIRR